MKSTLAFLILAAVMYVCGIGDKPETQTPANTAQAPAKSTPKPEPSPSKQAVLDELLKLEKEITEGVMNGDITLIAKYTTDDFELTGVDGKVQNKNEALADIKKEKNVKSVTITDPDLLSFSEDSAVLRYTQAIKLKTGQSGKARITDTFVKKDGKWMVKSEQQTMLK